LGSDGRNKRTGPWWADEDFTSQCLSFGLFSCPKCGDFYDSITRHYDESPQCAEDIYKPDDYYMAPLPIARKKIQPKIKDPALKVEPRLRNASSCLCGKIINSRIQDFCTECNTRRGNNAWLKKPHGHLMKKTRKEFPEKAAQKLRIITES
jgi:hypothetical protein